MTSRRDEAEQPRGSVKTAVLISGMHRSGTSALTRVLSLLGATLPEMLIPGRQDKGDADYWEGRRIVDLNQRVLRECGSWWAGWQSIDLDSLSDRDELIDEARAIIRAEFKGADLIAIKDPRVSRLIPLWSEALADEGYRTVHVLALRNPDRVAASLQRRDGMSAETTGLGWLAHLLDAEWTTRPYPRVVVSLDNLVADWRSEVDRMSRALGVRWPREVDAVAGEIDEYVDPKLAHHTAVPVPLATPVHEIFERWAGDDSSAEDTAELDRWRARLAPVRATASPTSILADQGRGAGRGAGWTSVVHDCYNVEAQAALTWLSSSQETDIVDEPPPAAEEESGPALRRVARRLREAGRPVTSRLRSARVVEKESTDAAQPAPPVVAVPTAPPPDVAVESTYVGPLMDEIVARARRNRRAPGLDPDYDLVADHFDHMNFLLSAPVLQENPRVDPIRAFMRSGAKAKNSPDINFSMAEYLRRYPDREKGPERTPYLTWLKQGRAAGEIADPAPSVEKMAHVLGRDVHDIVDQLTGIRDDLQERLRHGKLGEMFARAAGVEPLIAAAWPETTRPNILPVSSRVAVEQVSAIHRCQEAAGFRSARLLIVINRPRWGGGRRMEGHIAHALAARIEPAEIVVIHTDAAGTTPPGRYPDGVREVDFASAVEGLSHDNAQQALVALIRSFEADTVVNINSRVLHHAMTPYGRALTATERLFPIFFCNEQQAKGNWDGWSLRWFYRTFDCVTAVLTDSDNLRDELIDTYQLGGAELDRLHVLRAPVDPTMSPVAPPPVDPARRPQVFWAGRWDRQKRMDIVLDVARSMPEVDFRLWGESVLQGGPLVDVPDNVRLEGRYAHIGDLDLEEADLWLYTSAWDGVPSLLLEIGMTGVPIVGSLVGGTGEVLGEDDSWPVADIESPVAYEKAIRDVLADQPRARERAAALRERLLRERTQEAFAEQVTSLLLGEEEDR